MKHYDTAETLLKQTMCYLKQSGMLKYYRVEEWRRYIESAKVGLMKNKDSKKRQSEHARGPALVPHFNLIIEAVRMEKTPTITVDHAPGQPPEPDPLPVLPVNGTLPPSTPVRLSASKLTRPPCEWYLTSYYPG